MKAIRIALLTALMALSLGAFAAPAMGADAVWTKEGLPIQEPIEVELDGTLEFTSLMAKPAYCDMDAEATLKPGGEGEITKVDLSNCYHSTLECKQGVTSVTVPWSITPEWVGGSNPGRIDIEDIAMTVMVASPCNTEYAFINSTEGELSVSLHASYTEELTELNLSGLWIGAGATRGLWADLTVTHEGGIPVGFQQA